LHNVNTPNPYEPTANNNDSRSSRVALYAFIAFALAVILIALTGARAIAALQIAGMFGAVIVALLPLLVVAMIRRGHWSAYGGNAIIVAGVVLMTHVALTAATVELLLRHPFVLDLIPYDGVVSSTLNFVVPGSLIGFLIASIAPERRNRAFWFGGFLLAVGNAASIVYGHYFFCTLLGDRLAVHVWWM
jgi:hypothetical protein